MNIAAVARSSVACACVAFFASDLSAWQPGAGPEPSSDTSPPSALDPAYRLQFQRIGQLRAADGQQLVPHEVLSDPAVLYENGKYRMWFTAAFHPFSDDQEMGIAYAESDDGLVWSARLVDGEPELAVRATADSWDGGGIETASVVKAPDGRYFMYYTGDAAPKGTHSWAIGLAISDDGGYSWTKWSPGPVLTGESEWEGPLFKNGEGFGGVAEPSVIYDAGEGLFKMWYSALGQRTGKIAFRIGYATSPDGVNWTRHSGPVFEPDADGSWDDAVVSHVDVSYNPNFGYHMFYFGTSAGAYIAAERRGAVMIPGAIGHAYSADGLTWVRDANPILSTVPDSWEAWTVGGPTSLIQDDQVKLWYFGSASHNEYRFHLGLASATLPQQPPR